MKIFNIKTFLMVLALSGVFIGSVVYKNVYAQKKVHYHAGFAVFQDNKKLNFSDSKFMYIKPCTLNKEEEEEHEDEQIEKAHLHNNVGDVIHVERSGAIWRDLFVNIGFTVDYSKTEGFINGEKIEDFQSRPIEPADTLVVFIGKNDISRSLKLAPAKDYVEKVANKSTTCGE